MTIKNPKPAKKPPPPKVDPEVWERVLRERREKELAEGARFPGGKPFPIPDRDIDS